MSKRAIIVVPSQGQHAAHFKENAKVIREKVYRGRAKIVLCTVHLPLYYNPALPDFSEYKTTFADLRGRGFKFGSSLGRYSTALFISHSGIEDGPNLSYRERDYQPWRRLHKKGKDGNPYAANGRFKIDMLAPRARAFWSSVGQSLTAGGKIILLGCNSGAVSENHLMAYAQQVSNASGRRAYGAETSIAAANRETAVMHVRSIEKDGEPLVPPNAKFVQQHGSMKKFQPLVR